MAIPMPISDGSETRRVVVKVPVDMSFLLDLVARYQCATKKDLHERIWRAGVQSYLGVDQDDVDVASPLPRGTQPPKDVHKLVEAILG